MKHQRGWTLIEMVLTISVMAIVLGGLGVSMMRPIQDVFFLNKKVGVLKPIQLAMADMQTSLIDVTALESLKDDKQIVVHRSSQTLLYSCDDAQLKVRQQQDELTSGVLLNGYDCHFKVKNEHNAWVVSVYLNPQHQYSQLIHRVFYVPKETS